jgi:hypothetical protein
MKEGRLINTKTNTQMKVKEVERERKKKWVIVFEVRRSLQAISPQPQVIDSPVQEVGRSRRATETGIFPKNIL